jgi:hypothetical protein
MVRRAVGQGEVVGRVVRAALLGVADASVVGEERGEARRAVRRQEAPDPFDARRDEAAARAADLAPAPVLRELP